MGTEDGDNDNHWRLDKRVPLALILVMHGQTFAAGWWGATMATRVDQLERQVASAAPQGAIIVRLEAKVENIAEAIADIRAVLRKAN